MATTASALRAVPRRNRADSLPRAFRLLLTAAVIAAALWPGRGAAEVRDGEALLKTCTATIGAVVDFCYGYIDAVADYLFQQHALGAFTACVSAPPDDARLRFIVVQFLRDNRAIRHLAAPELIARALSEKFRCP